MESIKLRIPMMKSEHCQLTVRRLVENAGANVVAISSGQVSIALANGTAKESVVSAIEKGGYSVGQATQKPSCCAA